MSSFQFITSFYINDYDFACACISTGKYTYRYVCLKICVHIYYLHTYIVTCVFDIHVYKYKMYINKHFYIYASIYVFKVFNFRIDMSVVSTF